MYATYVSEDHVYLNLGSSEIIALDQADDTQQWQFEYGEAQEGQANGVTKVGRDLGIIDGDRFDLLG